MLVYECQGKYQSGSQHWSWYQMCLLGFHHNQLFIAALDVNVLLDGLSLELHFESSLQDNPMDTKICVYD